MVTKVKLGACRLNFSLKAEGGGQQPIANLGMERSTGSFKCVGVWACVIRARGVCWELDSIVKVS